MVCLRDLASSSIRRRMLAVKWARSPPLNLRGVRTSDSRRRQARVIRWLVALFPFDVAADARPLVGRHWFAGEHGVAGGPQIAAGDRLAAVRSAVVELAAVHEFAVLVE